MKKSAGMTLLDLLLAITILVVLMTSVYAVYLNYRKTEKAVVESRQVYAQGRIILDRINRDLAGAWLPVVARKNSSILYKFTGSLDRMDFITTAVMSEKKIPGLELAEVGYRVEEVPGERRMMLFRRQDETPDSDPSEDGTEILLTRDLIEMEIKYLDASGNAQDFWEGEIKSKLPVAIFIKIVLALDNDDDEDDDEEKDETFSSVARPALNFPKIKPITLPPGVGNFL